VRRGPRQETARPGAYDRAVAAIIVQAPPLGTPPGARRAFAVRRWGFLGLRLLISATGIFLVVRSVDVGAALHSLADANPFWFVAA
jgi:hypothetical protein